MPKNSNERYGKSLKIRLSDNWLETSTVNAPFEPYEGLIVPRIMIKNTWNIWLWVNMFENDWISKAHMIFVLTFH